MTIDLTGPVPHAHLVCDGCGSTGMLYRLIGTYSALCQHCFSKLHG